jgi:hypothetical protein
MDTSILPIKTKVVINGITIKDDDNDIHYMYNWSYEKKLNSGPIKTFTIKCPISITDVLDLLPSELFSEDCEVVISRGVATADETIIFRGVISDFQRTINGVVFECKDKLYLTTKQTITYSYDKDIDPSAGVLSEVFKDMINTYTTLTADDDSVQNTGTILTREKIICKSDTVFNQLLTQIVEPMYWNLFYNSIDDKVYFEPYGYETSSEVIETGVNLMNVPIWNYDESEVYNNITVHGAIQSINTEEIGQIDVTSGYTQASISLLNIPTTVRVICDAANPPTTERVVGVVGASTNYDCYIDATKKQIVWNTDVYEPNINDYCLVNYSFERPKPISVNSPESVELYGEKKKVIIKNEIKDVSDARLYAQNILEQYKNSNISSTLRVFDGSNLNIGQKLKVIDSNSDIDDFFYITSIKIEYPYKPDAIEVSSKIPEEDTNYFVFVYRKLKDLDRQSRDDFDFLIELKSFTNTFVYENMYLKIKEVSGDYIFLENSEKKYIELFYSDEFKDSGTADWDTTNEWLELDDTETMTSELFCYDLNNSDDNAYKSVNVSITGTGLNNLKFYIGEFDGTDLEYTEVTLTGTTTSRTGSLSLTNDNKEGLKWKTEADGGTTVITQLNINYTK